MHRKRKYLILLSVFASYFLFVSTVFASPEAYRLGLTRARQEMPNWCWAASAKVIGNYKGYNYNQSRIVSQIKGSVKDEGATTSETVEAIRFAIGYSRAVNLISPMKYDAMKDTIYELDPIACWMSWNGGGAHIVVIGGYDGSKRVQILDPCGNCETRYYSYEKLLKEIKLQSGKGHCKYMFELV